MTTSSCILCVPVATIGLKDHHSHLEPFDVYVSYCDRRLTLNSSVCFKTSYNTSTAATFEVGKQYDNPEATPS